jgi:hypothetical protein
VRDVELRSAALLAIPLLVTLGLPDSWAWAGQPVAAMPTVTLTAVHPRLMTPLLSADPASTLEAPLKFAVIEYPDNGCSMLAK